MIIVWGAIEAKAEHLDEVLSLSQAHVARSRLEPGCISHSVSIDAENPHRLVFFEEWEDMAALQTHFQVPASNEFVAAVGAMAVDTPRIRLFDSTELK